MTDFNLDVLVQMILDRAEKNKVAAGLNDVERGTKEIQDATKKATQESNLMARTIMKNARLMAKELGELREKADWINRGSQPLFAAGVAGITAITLSARNYIQNTDEINETTKAWAENSERVHASQMRIGKVAAEAVLPLFEKLATITEKAADFVEKNPGILEAGLKASIIAAGLGGIGMLVAKGITLYADIKMIAVGDMQLRAARIMADAANKQLAASTGMKIPSVGNTGKVAPTVATAGAAVAGGGIAAIVGTVLAVLGGIGVGLWVYDQLAKATGGARVNQIATGGAHVFGQGVGSVAQNLGMSPEEAERKTVVFAALIGKLTGAIDESSPLWIRATESIKQHNRELLDTKTATQNATTSLGANASANLANATASQLASAAINQNASANTEQANETNKSTQGLARLSGMMYSAGASAGFFSNLLSRIPSALSSVASGISNFINNIIRSITSRTGTGSLGAKVHDYTGYAYKGLYAMAQNGQREFVLSGNATKLAEQMVGGQLTEQNVMSLGGKKSGITVQWNDSRSFSGEITDEMRRVNKQDTLETLEEFLRTANVYD